MLSVVISTKTAVIGIHHRDTKKKRSKRSLRGSRVFLFEGTSGTVA